MTRRVYRRAHASVRFMSPTLDPLAITSALRLPPSTHHRAGEPRLEWSRERTIIDHGDWKEGIWCLSTEPPLTSPRLAVHLRWLLDLFEPKSLEIAELYSQGIQSDIFCFSAGTTSQPPAIPRILREQAERLGFVIRIDHYRLDEADSPSHD